MRERSPSTRTSATPSLIRSTPAPVPMPPSGPGINTAVTVRGPSKRGWPVLHRAGEERCSPGLRSCLRKPRPRTAAEPHAAVPVSHLVAFPRLSPALETDTLVECPPLWSALPAVAGGIPNGTAIATSPAPRPLSPSLLGGAANAGLVRHAGGWDPKFTRGIIVKIVDARVAVRHR